MNSQAKNILATTQAAGALLTQAAAELGTGNVGRMLKFAKGKYFSGADEIPIGREMIAHITALARGWIKFADGKVAERRIGKVIDGFRVPDREELGDNDPSQWERDSANKPRDPWTRQVYLPLEDPGTGEVIVFITGSHGGRGAVGTLCESAARCLDRGQPVIRLGVSSYRHREYGRVEVPDFPILNWTGGPPTPRKSVGAELNDEIPF